MAKPLLYRFQVRQNLIFALRVQDATCPKEKIPANPIIKSQQEATTAQMRHMIIMFIMNRMSPTKIGKIAMIPYKTPIIIAICFKRIPYLPFPIRPWGRSARVANKSIKSAMMP